MIDFFQTLNVKRFVFADGDNASNPKVFIDFLKEQNYLDLDTQIICFIGANTNQNTWYNTAVKYVKSLNNKSSFNLTPIRIQTEGSNALDMVLSSYVGLAMGQNSRAEFIIASNDNDYESVIEHFGSLGIQIKKDNINLKNTNKKNELNFTLEQMNEVIESLKKIRTNRLPKTISKFKNFLKNNGFKFITNENIDNIAKIIIEKLETKDTVKLKDQSLNWENSSIDDSENNEIN